MYRSSSRNMLFIKPLPLGEGICIVLFMIEAGSCFDKGIKSDSRLSSLKMKRCIGIRKVGLIKYAIERATAIYENEGFLYWSNRHLLLLGASGLSLTGIVYL